MNDKGKRWNYTAHTGKPIKSGNITVTPQSKALSLKNPNFGIIWNRPTSILVEVDNKSQSISIIDYTRFVQLVLYGICIILFVMTVIRKIISGRKKDV